MVVCPTVDQKLYESLSNYTVYSAYIYCPFYRLQNVNWKHIRKLVISKTNKEVSWFRYNVTASQFWMNLADLSSLVLSDNSAGSSVSFEDGFFDRMGTLEHLDLSRVFCRRLPRDSFRKLTKLKSLSMNNCYLREPPLMMGNADTDGSKRIFDSLLPRRFINIHQ